MSDQANLLCNVCSGPARNNGKLYKCDFCDEYSHTVCAKLATVTFKNKPEEACPACISKSMPSLPALNSTRSRNMSNSSLSEAAGSTGTSDGVLERILKKFGNLKKSIESTIDTRFNNFEEKLLEINVLGARVTANEASLSGVKQDLADVKRELADIKKKLDGNEVYASDSVMIDRVLNLEKRNAELSERIAMVYSRDYPFSTDMVIGGSAVPSGCGLKTLATTVLASVHSDIDARDIVSVRTLTSRTVRDEIPVPSDTTDQPSSHFSATTSTALSRPPSILVTLTSPALLEAIIRSEIKLGKLHTTALASTLSEDTIMSITPAHININEFLPSLYSDCIGLFVGRLRSLLLI